MLRTSLISAALVGVAVLCATAAVIAVSVAGVPRAGRGTIRSRVADALALHQRSFSLLPNSYLFPI